MSHIDQNDDLPAVRAKLERLNRFYAMLCQINRHIVRAETPQELYEAVCRIAVESGAFSFAWVGLVEPATRQVIAVARAGSAVDLDPLPVTGFDADEDDPCPIITAIREGKTSIAGDIAHGAAPWRHVLAEAGIRSLAALPLRQGATVIGSLAVAENETDYFKKAECRLLSEIADDISFALGAMHREEQRGAAETKIQYLAYYDSQTGLPGRLLFAERLTALSRTAGDRNIPVMVVKLRRYHGILQTLGQEIGVVLARAVVARLESVLTTAPVARVSESEFAFALEDPLELDQIEETAWRVHEALAQAIPAAGNEVFLDPFVGIALSPRDGVPGEALNAALIAAASGAKDPSSCCRFFVADMDRGSRRKLDLEAALRRALENREFVLHYQPQVDLASGAVVGAEALVRWQRPGYGLVPPLEFIPLLEETGLIVPLGEWIVEEVCRQAKSLQDEGLPPLRMAVNLSARQFQEDDISGLVRRVLNATGLEPHCLELELTESTVLVNADAVIRTLNELKATGISIALDDFGTGYSSLSYLQRLPVARIKIDQSFVTNITSNPHDAAIVRAVVGMAHSLGIATIAEGVETEGQLGYLRGLQCEEMQGYYFSRPLPADELAALLRDQRRLTPPEDNSQRERVLLLVDDEPNILSSLRRVLRPTGFRVLTSTSAKEGFDLLATNPVGVVVCDQRMPDMTGTEFLRRVKELYPGTVRIILSGYTELHSVIDAVNRGAVYRFLTKPWDEEALLESLRNAFHLYEMEIENRDLSKKVEELKASGAGNVSPERDP